MAQSPKKLDPDHSNPGDMDADHLNPGDTDGGEPEVDIPMGNDKAGGELQPDGDPGQQKWQKLKELLVGTESERIVELESKPPKADLLAQSLPEAVRASSEDSEKLAEALRPTVEQGLMHSARKNPDELAEAIYPVLGPAIRRSIRAALQSSLQSMNVALENSFSPRGIRWRMEAWRTGKPFGEVVLLHSLEYRVEQVYWIHKESGVLLQDASRGEEGQQDADMVSGMLAAIQDFVQDSFHGAEEGELEQIEVSGFRVLLAQGHSTGLALLVRGIPPEELSEDMHAVLEELNHQYGQDLEGFAGDVEPFKRSKETLTGLIGERSKPRGKKGIAPYVLGGLAAILLVWWLVATIGQSRLESRRAQALALIEQEPGYHLVGEPDEDSWTGLKDPHARPLEAVLGDLAGKLEMDWSLKPFQSLEEPIVQRRVQAVMQAPSGVRAEMRGSQLILEGRAPRAWAGQAKALGLAIGGVDRVDTSALIDSDRENIEKRIRALDQRFLPFGNGSAALDPAIPEVRARMTALEQLDKSIQEYGGFLQVDLVAVAGRQESYDRGILRERLRETHKVLSKLPLAVTILRQSPEPEADRARMARPGVRLELKPTLLE